MARLQRVLLVCLALGILGLPAVRAQDEEEPASPDAPPVLKTDVIGQVPIDLRGVWLIVSNGKFPNGKFRNTLDIESIVQRDGQLAVEPLLVELPAEWQQQIDAANKTMQEWKPTPEQVAALGRSLDSLQRVDPKRYVKHTVRIVAPAKYGEALKPELQGLVKDTLFSVEIQHDYRPQPITDANTRNVQLMSDKAFYGIQHTEPEPEGEHIRTILAAGFVPIPINTNGPFVMHRLRGPENMPRVAEGPSSGGVMGFLQGLFRGCK
jgi:hypothetical protein